MKSVPSETSTLISRKEISDEFARWKQEQLRRFIDENARYLQKKLPSSYKNKAEDYVAEAIAVLCNPTLQPLRLRRGHLKIRGLVLFKAWDFAVNDFRTEHPKLAYELQHRASSLIDEQANWIDDAQPSWHARISMKDIEHILTKILSSPSLCENQKKILSYIVENDTFRKSTINNDKVARALGLDKKKVARTLENVKILVKREGYLGDENDIF